MRATFDSKRDARAKRVLVSIAGAAVIVTALISSPVSAADAVAGCGNGQDLSTIDQAIDAVDWSIYTPEGRAEVEALIRSLDVNGDDHLCVKQYKASNGRDKQWGAEDYIVTRLGENKVPGQLD